jgi:carboxypeptidase Taq
MALVASSQELLAWDELTLLPEEASEHRGRQLAWLACRHHDLLVDPRLQSWLAELAGSPLIADAHCAAAINVREMRRQRERHVRLPRRLIEELASVTTLAQHEWQVARRKNDYRHFQPWLDRVLVLKREEARALAEGPDLYAPLLAEYEPGLTTEELRVLFAELQAELAALVPELVQRQAREARPTERPALLRGSFPQLAQEALCTSIAADLGFDFRRGRLNTAVHPFTSHLGPHDCRLAIRYDEGNLREALYALLHELGHGLYDQGLPTEHYGMPAGEAASLSVHEAIARLWENAVGRSLGFWHWLLPRVQAAFPGQLAGARPEDVWREVNRVRAGVNRVAADEATYNLHIILRFELEQSLVAGDLRAGDLPAAWNERYRQLLGVVPASDREGVLQDGHWAAGMFGYFPTYTIGNVLAAQLYAVASADIGNLEDQFAAGEFQPLQGWLSSRVFQHGKRFTTSGLAQAVCGTPLDSRPLVSRLRSAGADRP